MGDGNALGSQKRLAVLPNSRFLEASELPKLLETTRSWGVKKNSRLPQKGSDLFFQSSGVEAVDLRFGRVHTRRFLGGFYEGPKRIAQIS